MRSLLIGLLTILSLNALAGKEGGNGGGVHYCPERSQQEMYDVYEGRTRYNLEIIESHESVDNIIAQALKKLANTNPNFAFEVKQQINALMTPAKFRVRNALKLSPVPDANILMVDEGCSYQQLANWDDVTEAVFVKNEYFKSFSNLNKAALYIHEAIYKVARIRVSVKNSDEVRRLVAELLSTNEKLTTTFKQKGDFRVNAPYAQTQAGIEHSYSSESYEELTINLGSLTREQLKDTIGEITITVKEVKELKELFESKKTEYEVALKEGASKRQINLLKKELDTANANFESYVATFCLREYAGCPLFAYAQMTDMLASYTTGEDVYLELGVIGTMPRDLTIEIKVKLHDAKGTILSSSFKINAPKIEKYPQDKMKKKLLLRINQNYQE